jgi:hypothetical protein
MDRLRFRSIRAEGAATRGEKLATKPRTSNLTQQSQLLSKRPASSPHGLSFG